MPFSVTCEGCGRVSTAPDEFEGKRGRCKQCGNVAQLKRTPAPVATTRTIHVQSWPDSLPAVAEVDSDLDVDAMFAASVPAVASAPVPTRAVAPKASPPATVRFDDDIVVPEPATQACPFCSETILRGAKKCKHCGEFLDPVLRAQYAAPAQPQIVVHNSATAIAGGRGEARWNPVVAFFLSMVLPGAGQMYKGQPVNAIVWFVAVVFGYVAFVVPGAILHVCCMLGAMSGDPYR